MLPLAPEVLIAVLSFQAACEFGVLRVVSQTRGRDYCILYNPQWAHLPHDLSKVVSVTLGHTSCGPVPVVCLLPLPWESVGGPSVPLGLASHAQE